MAAPRDATHSIKNCYKCGHEFERPAKTGHSVWMHIVPSRENPLMFVPLCDECFEAEGGVWWVGGNGNV